MLSKAKIKFVKSLQIKKYRKQEQCFVVEGKKSVLELLTSDFQVVTLLATQQFLEESGSATPPSVKVVAATEAELASLGEYKSNDGALAVVRMKENESFVTSSAEYVLVLDDIRDPGNLGTIIRTADWFGVNKIVASEETADVYNPKVIHSTMGSFTRVSIFYTDLVEYLSGKDPVYGTFLDGADVHDFSFGNGGFIVVGNESQGISPQVEKVVTQRITIPSFGKAESLNAAIATGIVLDRVRGK